MSPNRWGPGCCCQGCSICSDDFDRADGTDVDTGSSCGWTEVSGDWFIDSNVLGPDNPNEIARCDTAAAAGTIAVRASVVMIGAADDGLAGACRGGQACGLT
ncbi:MAG TPA: hypothetical protein VGJ16_11840 [Pirellulales bacterium]|jgi:hypothetical protein